MNNTFGILCTTGGFSTPLCVHNAINSAQENTGLFVDTTVGPVNGVFQSVQTALDAGNVRLRIVDTFSEPAALTFGGIPAGSDLEIYIDKGKTWTTFFSIDYTGSGGSITFYDGEIASRVVGANSFLLDAGEKLALYNANFTNTEAGSQILNDTAEVEIINSTITLPDAGYSFRGVGGPVATTKLINCMFTGGGGSMEAILSGGGGSGLLYVMGCQTMLGLGAGGDPLISWAGDNAIVDGLVQLGSSVNLGGVVLNGDDSRLDNSYIPGGGAEIGGTRSSISNTSGASVRIAGTANFVNNFSTISLVAAATVSIVGGGSQHGITNCFFNGKLDLDADDCQVSNCLFSGAPGLPGDSTVSGAQNKISNCRFLNGSVVLPSSLTFTGAGSTFNAVSNCDMGIPLAAVSTIIKSVASPTTNVVQDCRTGIALMGGDFADTTGSIVW